MNVKVLLVFSIVSLLTSNCGDKNKSKSDAPIVGREEVDLKKQNLLAGLLLGVDNIDWMPYEVTLGWETEDQHEFMNSCLSARVWASMSFEPYTPLGPWIYHCDCLLERTIQILSSSSQENSDEVSMVAKTVTKEVGNSCFVESSLNLYLNNYGRDKITISKAVLDQEPTWDIPEIYDYRKNSEFLVGLENTKTIRNFRQPQ